MTRHEDARQPVLQMFGYGLQHVLSVFGVVFAVPIIVGGVAGLAGGDRALLTSCALFVSGVVTVLQRTGPPLFGSQPPLVQGLSFASVSTILSIVAKAGDGRTGLRTVLDAALKAALIGSAIAPFFSKIVRFFPPSVTGCIITGQAVVGDAPNSNYLDPGSIGRGTDSQHLPGHCGRADRGVGRDGWHHESVRRCGGRRRACATGSFADPRGRDLGVRSDSRCSERLLGRISGLVRDHVPLRNQCRQHHGGDARRILQRVQARYAVESIGGGSGPCLSEILRTLARASSVPNHTKYR